MSLTKGKLIHKSIVETVEFFTAATVNYALLIAKLNPWHKRKSQHWLTFNAVDKLMKATDLFHLHYLPGTT